MAETRRVGLVAGGLVVALVAGFGLGRWNATPAGSASTPTAAVPSHTHAQNTGGTATGPAGLSISSGGYTLVPESTTFPHRASRPFRFRVHGSGGTPVTAFPVVHDKPMHLVVVRRDLSGYQHLHPTMAADGTWSVGLTLPEAGSWRAYADFAVTDPAGAQTALTLGTDLTVTGDYRPRPLPAPAQKSTVDGFTVTFEGTPKVGATQPILFRVTGELQRYLGSYGHLVMLREGDLGYVHVHPEAELVGGAVKFWLAAPSPGRYRVYFDFQVGGVVRTAEFTLTVP